jgi:hypothetical protein
MNDLPWTCHRWSGRNSLTDVLGVCVKSYESVALL